MHQYKLEIFLNDEQTGVAALYPEATRYADNAEQARLIYQEYRKQIWESNGWKKYKIRVCILAYKEITNPEDFFAMFEA